MINPKNKAAVKLLDKIYDVLVRMEKRLKVIEDSVKKGETTKQILND